jgi:hypothetical protein
MDFRVLQHHFQDCSDGYHQQESNAYRNTKKAQVLSRIMQA